MASQKIDVILVGSAKENKYAAMCLTQVALRYQDINPGDATRMAGCGYLTWQHPLYLGSVTWKHY